MGYHKNVLIMIAMIASPLAFAQQQSISGLQVVQERFNEHCAVCHGERMQGAPQGTPLIGQDLIHGDSMEDLYKSIDTGYPEKGMPSWRATFSEQEIKSLALWISEHRGGMLYSEFNLNSDLEIPTEVIATTQHRLRIETVIEDIDPLPYSIALLPDGSILLTEKMRGMRIISASGEKSALIKGTPKVYDEGRHGGGGLYYGQGWLLDVTIHPDYEKNGWIYLHHTDRCFECSARSREHKRSASMNRMIRGRIVDGHWVDEELIWEADRESYGLGSDVAAGGRTAIDPDGYVFFSVGMHGRDSIQDLSAPDGKIHRVHDDGRIPIDNPFYGDESALNSIWSYGHRSPQGLEFKTDTRELWGTEHGPRGGDEINLLLPGRNYGWPLFSLGQNYNGTEVAHGRTESEITIDEIEQPVVDWTPSPAVSSFVFYKGAAFPHWQGQMLVGTLKAADLVRVRIEDGALIEQETLIEDLSRIRDIELDHHGVVYLLLEHEQGGKIVRLVPDDVQAVASSE